MDSATERSRRQAAENAAWLAKACREYHASDGEAGGADVLALHVHSLQREDLLLQLSDREQWTIPSSTAELVHLEFAVDSDTLEVLRSFIDDDTVQRSFKDRRTTLELPSTQSTVRTLRLVYELLQVEWQAFMWLSDENPEECMSLFQASFTRLFLKAELVSYLDRDYMQVRMDRYHDDLGLERQPVDWPMLLSNVLPRAGLRRRGKFGPNRGEHLWLPFIV